MGSLNTFYIKSHEENAQNIRNLKDFKYIHFSWRTYKISDKNLIHVHRDVFKTLRNSFQLSNMIYFVVMLTMRNVTTEFS